MITSLSSGCSQPISLRGLSLTSANRKIGLYGGSFNPVHAGHSHVALNALLKLGLDEIWCLVSPGNPLKDGTPDMAPLAIRLEKTRQFIRHPKIKVLDLETRLNTRFSADTLDKLCKIMPLTKFVWIMGADNAVIFHHWGCWREIMQRIPIAIFARTGYSEIRRTCRATNEFQRFRTSPAKLVKQGAPGWCMIDGKRHPASATFIRRQSANSWWR